MPSSVRMRASSGGCVSRHATAGQPRLPVARMHSGPSPSGMYPAPPGCLETTRSASASDSGSRV